METLLWAELRGTASAMSSRKTLLRISDEETQKLIELVRQNPPLYQMKGRSFKDSEVKNSIWKQIAQQLGRNVDECKTKWKTIRDYHNRKKKKPETIIKAKDEKKVDQLSFLDNVSVVDTSNSNEDPFYDLEARQQRQIVCDVITDPNIDGETEQVANSVSSEEQEEQEIELKAKRICSRPVKDEIRKEQTERTALLRDLTKHLQEQSSGDEFCDPALTMFFKSIAATVATFSPLLKAKIKVEIMNLVSRYEIEHVTQSNTTDSNGHLTHGQD